ncbi:AraC family transcriptional regulator [Pseudomonas sp. GD03842]|uniref:AraC family transcriptional regulator n=1 Tax=Pseudomonas sp. GD03842 TaxID=2975385 RepID=UPI00244AA603|nr:AraC family transcriptional regulator [Pseudomonas sp. GD03842]MDH0747036.1 AraC family transcriptional regulator [Pseudomonas sp. GD03842]
MVDPLAEVVSLLQPTAPFSKRVIASAPWAVRRSETGRPFYFVVLEGACRLTVENAEDEDTMTLTEGDFVLIPAARAFSTSSLDRLPPAADEAITSPLTPIPGGVRVGDPEAPVTVRMLVGHCVFGSQDATLLVPLLPRWVHVRGEQRLATLVQLVGDEARAQRPARDIVLARLLEVLLIEALRSTGSSAPSPGLLRGLSDPKLALALHRIHEQTAQPWNVAQLASAAGMSRSAFFEAFGRAVGMPPMEYLLTWRMALAKRWLRQGEQAISEIADRVGYRSVSAFGVAFTRHVGMPPGRYAALH